ncbi:hypothetical protein N7507_000297 [Penicillium longicatenatum]|nr:hypothetical protein N7507_000297 [Penicillium longicatenatum]
MMRTPSAKVDKALDRLCVPKADLKSRWTRGIVQKERRVNAPGCAEIRRPADRLTCGDGSAGRRGGPRSKIPHLERNGES